MLFKAYSYMNDEHIQLKLRAIPFKVYDGV